MIWHHKAERKHSYHILNVVIETVFAIITWNKPEKRQGQLKRYWSLDLQKTEGQTSDFSQTVTYFHQRCCFVHLPVCSPCTFMWLLNAVRVDLRAESKSLVPRVKQGNSTLNFKQYEILISASVFGGNLLETGLTSPEGKCWVGLLSSLMFHC